MGAYMSSPKTEKEEDCGESKYFSYGASAMQGWRVDMEDAHIASMSDAATPETAVGFYGVFDGHGGREVAHFCARHMYEVWKDTPGVKENDIPKSLVQTYLKLDEIMMLEENAAELQELAKKPDANNESEGVISRLQIRQMLYKNSKWKGNGEDEDGEKPDSNMVEGEAEEPEASLLPVYDNSRQDIAGPSAGCTSVVAVIRKGEMIVANAGDSRCIFSRRGEAIAMSRDHKPLDLDESERIHKAGGFVTDGRVNGSLNLSRAIGDMEYKQRTDLKPEEHPVTAYPEIKAVYLHEGDEFAVLACDGIWDVMTNQDVVNFVRERIGKMPLQTICSEICDNCLAPDTTGTGKGCDNMTVMIVKIKEELCQGNEHRRVLKPRLITV